MTRFYSPIHPLFFTPFTKGGARLRERALRVCIKAANKIMGRVLIDAIEWAHTKPEEALIALAEAERRLKTLVDDYEIGPLVPPILCELTGIIEQTLDRLAIAEREGLVTINLVP